jgi:hypothetical protein
MKKLLLTILLLSSFNVFSQQIIKKKGQLPILELLDSALTTKLDSIINYEKTCKYYGNSLFFYLTISPKPNSNLEFYFESGDSFSYEYVFSRPNQNSIGCFIYNKHIFVVENYLCCPSMFKKTARIQKIKYKVLVLEDAIEDDSFTKWIYILDNGKLYFVKRGSYCDDNWRNDPNR